MIFWASSEIYKDVDASSERARTNVEPYLNTAFATSSLKGLEVELRYIPIIMPVGMLESYPARSKLHMKERVYLCAPQLDYEVFVSGTFEDQLKEYLRGVVLSAPYLADLGATQEQIEDFKKIIANAVEDILLEQPAETRH